MIDVPAGYSMPTIPHRPDVVYNTPYRKGVEGNRTTYDFSQGFYHTPQVQIQHPVAELMRNENFRLVLKYIAQFDRLLPDFENFDKALFDNIFRELVTVILDNGLQKAVFERTPDDGLMLKASYCEYRIYLEVDREADEVEGYEAVMTAYQDKKPVFFAAGSITSVFQQFFDFIGSAILA